MSTGNLRSSVRRQMPRALLEARQNKTTLRRKRMNRRFCSVVRIVVGKPFLVPQACVPSLSTRTHQETTLWSLLPGELPQA